MNENNGCAGGTRRVRMEVLEGRMVDLITVLSDRVMGNEWEYGHEGPKTAKGRDRKDGEGSNGRLRATGVAGQKELVTVGFEPTQLALEDLKTAALDQLGQMTMRMWMMLGKFILKRMMSILARVSF